MKALQGSRGGYVLYSKQDRRIGSLSAAQWTQHSR